MHYFHWVASGLAYAGSSQWRKAGL